MLGGDRRISDPSAVSFHADFSGLTWSHGISKFAAFSVVWKMLKFTPIKVVVLM